MNSASSVLFKLKLRNHYLFLPWRIQNDVAKVLPAKCRFHSCYDIVVHRAECAVRLMANPFEKRIDNELHELVCYQE